MQKHCDVCGGAGWRAVRGNILERCSCYEEIPLDDPTLREMRLPRAWFAAGLHDYTPASPAQSAALELVSRCAHYVENRDGVPVPFGALLTGRQGIGKTHLAIGLLKGLRRIGFRCRYVQYTGWLETVRSEWLETRGFGPADPVMVRAVQELLSADVVLLDDVTPVSDLPAIVMDVPPELIRHRHNHMKSLIVTSRLPLEGPGNSLTLEWGYPTVSRLIAMCAVVHLQ